MMTEVTTHSIHDSFRSHTAPWQAVTPQHHNIMTSWQPPAAVAVAVVGESEWVECSVLWLGVTRTQGSVCGRTTSTCHTYNSHQFTVQLDDSIDKHDANSRHKTAATHSHWVSQSLAVSQWMSTIWYDTTEEFNVWHRLRRSIDSQTTVVRRC